MLILADTPEMEDANIIMTIKRVNSTSGNMNNRLGNASPLISRTSSALSWKSVGRGGKWQQLRLSVATQFWDLNLNDNHC